MNLPEQYKFLADEGAPRMLVEALKDYGTLETPGPANNQKILDWADEVGEAEGVLRWIGSWYKEDSTPWCGLAVAVWAIRAGKTIGFNNPLGAKNWAQWGDKSPQPSLGDVLVFSRKGGGHVGLYVGEDHEAYHVLGGNQSDSVNITRIMKNRLLDARRMYKIGCPANVRVIKMDASGKVSENEA